MDVSPQQRQLRVALVHSRYSSRSPSGENVAVDQHLAALRRGGVEAEVFQSRADDREQLSFYQVRSAWGVATGRGPSPAEELAAWNPDVVHVHNLFPNFGKSWLKSWPGPVVHTLHNFRPLCSSGIFFRDGHPCTDCLVARSPAPGVRHRCYRSSALATLPIALSNLPYGDELLLRRADKLLVVYPQALPYFVAAGVPAQKLSVLSNFVPAPDVPEPGSGGPGWLYVGQLVDAKGIRQVLERWPSELPLTVVGDGPLRRELEELAPDSVTFAGQVERSAVLRMMRESLGMLFPSRGFEGAALTYVEALASGTPVLAWRPSSVADDVAADGTGRVASDETLVADLAAARAEFPGLRDNARMTFETKYSEKVWLARLMDVYFDAIAQRPLL